MQPGVTESGEKAKARIATARANLNAGGTRKGATIVAPEVATAPITPESMTPTPVIDVPTPEAPTKAPALASDLAVMAEDDFTKRLTAEKEQLDASSGDALKDYLSAVTTSKGLAGLTEEEYARQNGVNDITPELNDINDQIRREQRALDIAKRNIVESGGGLASGAVAEISNLERVSLQKQADLAIIQMAVQGRYDSAKEIADRAVQARLEQQNIYNEALKFTYEEQKDKFTTAEQREFETLLQDRDRAFRTKENELKSISDLSLDALANGAPKEIASQMRQASSLAEAMDIGGQYVGLLERQRLQSELASAAISRRKNLIDLALAGDKDAMSQLGIDPNAPDAADKVKTQDEINRIDAEIATVSGMLSNEDGLKTSSGAVASPFLSSFGKTVPVATGLGAGAGSVVPGLGTMLGAGAGLITGVGTGFLEYNQQRTAQKKFLADAEYVLANMTANKVRELKEAGVAFTPMTDKDTELIGKASNKLNAYAIRDNGTLVGFTDEEGARNAIIEIQGVLEDVREREMRKLVSNDEIAEIEKQ